ncbi:hypothetical protein Clacol_008204 [Clathrus columnatus]|uniref:Uncharacterized protein n=1 Tax=Clathrus columnatus TaxID=1419009 RepID=A0AAV5AJV5_9AGAM|nr:hypothetical protein Clacol_008204 [Clathrus columnatus]
MPPKPRMVFRKPSQNVNTEQIKTSNPEQARNGAAASTSQSSPFATILDSELNTLEASYRDIVVATGKVFQFYSDTRKERVMAYSPYPPISTTRMLGRSLEKYDQTCDTIETRLQYAIAVIQRNINKLKARSAAEASIHRSTICSTATYASLTSASEQAMLTDAPGNVLLQLGGSTLPMPNRRQSAILSSLHRPGFPSKVDISSMNMGNPHVDTFTTPVNVTVDLGLTRAPSPVTLAPKAGRTLPSDPTLDMFINPAHQTITELSTEAETQVFTSSSNSTAPILDGSVIDLTSESVPGTQLGDSADKPIELDMDTNYDDMDLFGDPSTIESPPSAIQTNSNPISISRNLDTSLSTDGLNQTDILKNSIVLSPQVRSPTRPVSYSSVETYRQLEEQSRFDLTNIDFSALTGLFNTGNGGGAPQPSNAASQDDLDLMSQLLAIDGNNSNVTDRPKVERTQ